MAERSPVLDEAASPVQAHLEVSNPDLIVRLSGPVGRVFREIEKRYGISMGVRGTRLLFKGPAAAVRRATTNIQQLLSALRDGKELSEDDLLRAIRTVEKHPEVKISDFMDREVLATPRRTITAKGLAQTLYVQAMQEKDVVFGIGPAGTGKTYLAMAMAVRALGANQVKRIVLTRPAVEAGEKLGFLPGDLAEKVNPYLRPLYDALHDMMEPGQVEMLMGRGGVEVAPLAFMRGRTLSDSFVILDEAQNATAEQMKMFLTRIGQGSRAVVTGDVTQTDLPFGRRSGLADAESLLTGIEGIGFCYFSDEDVVRHPLVARIVRAYELRDERVGRARDSSRGSSEARSTPNEARSTPNEARSDDD